MAAMTTQPDKAYPLSVQALRWEIQSMDKPVLLTNAALDDMRRLYPDVFLTDEITKAHQYYTATFKEMFRDGKHLRGFLMNWLGRHQKDFERAITWFAEVEG